MTNATGKNSLPQEAPKNYASPDRENHVGSPSPRMQRPRRRRSAGILRRSIQGLSLALFLWLLCRSVSPLPETLLPVDSFLRLDPLVSITIPLAARDWIETLWPGLALLALTVIFGRFFCGYLCPMGITLDLANAAGKALSRKQSGKAAAKKRDLSGDPGLPKGLRYVKYLILAFCLGAALAGLNTIYWASPIPLVTRFYALLAYPVLISAGNSLYAAGLPLIQSLDVASLSYLQILPKRFDTLYFLLFFFGMLFVLERLRPRFWCRYLCPAGALLSLASLRPLWRRRVNECISCGRCVRICSTKTTSSIEVNTKQLECIVCRSCVDACPIQGIEFSFRKKPFLQGVQHNYTCGSSANIYSPHPETQTPADACATNTADICAEYAPDPAAADSVCTQYAPDPSAPQLSYAGRHPPKHAPVPAATARILENVPDPSAQQRSSGNAHIAQYIPVPAAAARTPENVPDPSAQQRSPGNAHIAQYTPDPASTGTSHTENTPVPAATTRTRSQHAPEPAALRRSSARGSDGEGKPDAGFLPSRRAFLASSGAGIGAALIGISHLDSLLASAPRGLLWAENCIRPPGSLPEPDFLDRCLRCGQCMKVCPSNALQPSWFAAGVEGMFSPVLTARRGPCEPDCNACGQVCPTRAILPLPLKEKQWAKIGTAVVRPGLCLAWAEGRSCVVCEEVCPYGAIKCEQKAGAGVPAPVVKAEKCFGCGYCEQYCPVRVPAIVVLPLNALRLKDGAYSLTARNAGLSLVPASKNPGYEEYSHEIPDGGLPPGFSE